MDFNILQNGGELSFFTKMLIYLLFLIIIFVFAYFKKTYRENIFYILKNILVLFKNFLHWNLSKIIINIYSFLTGTLLSLVFLLISFFIVRNLSSKFDPNAILSLTQTGVLNTSLIASFIQNIWLITALIFCLLIILTFYILTFAYGNILLQNVYKHYLSGEKIAFLKNWYFSFKYIEKFLGITTWICIYLLKPLGILVGGFLILFGLTYFGIISTDQGGNGSIMLGLVSLLIILISLIYFFYLGIKLSFSYVTLVFSEDININSKLFVEESFTITKGNIGKIIGLSLPFLIINFIIGEIYSLLNIDIQILKYLFFLINFLIFSGISYMISISIYFILKKTPPILKEQIIEK